jgi:hypothetical protein
LRRQNECVRISAKVTVADVIRAVEGPIASVRGERPDTIVYEGSAAPLRDVWIELRSSLGHPSGLDP